MEQRNMIMAFVLSMLVLVSWQALFPADDAGDNKQDRTLEHQQTPVGDVPETQPSADKSAGSSASTGQTAAPRLSAPKAQGSIVSTPVATLHNKFLTLKINAQGAIVSATTSQYRQTIDPDSPPVSVLDVSSDHPRYINAGVVGLPLPVFRVLDASSDGSSVRLQAALADGGVWQRELTLNAGGYLVTMHDHIAGSRDYRMFRQVVARNPSRETSNLRQFSGPVSLIDDKLVEHSYDDLDKESPIRQKARGGWTGIMDHYFIAAIIGGNDKVYDYYYKGDGKTYQAGMIANGEHAQNGTDFSVNMYIGPKAIEAMAPLGVSLERSVDYGWFAVIAKPLHSLLLWLHSFIGNYGLCIIVLVVLIKLLFYWPTQKSYESMAAMRKLQPEMQRLRELYGDDRQKMGQEMMALYKKHKVNPMGGCLPIIIQIPVFFALYKALLVSIELRHAPFYGWIHDLSAMDPYYVLPVVMGATMLVQQRLNPAPPDPMQAKVMKFLPILFTFMFLFFPSGLVLYWLVNNVLSIAQQWYILKVRQAL